ncbi:MAG TPA: hypothetical protein PLB42_10085, partial [Kiritimatiellia bacterium]|nr:hypothetical protein [Kiritimatiellia bacterium]
GQNHQQFNQSEGAFVVHGLSFPKIHGFTRVVIQACQSASLYQINGPTIDPLKTQLTLME